MWTKILVSIIIVVGLAGCKKGVKVNNYSDPFDEAFRGKDIKYALAYSDDTLVYDTLTFDPNGSIIQVKELWASERNEFDELFFITRRLNIDDVPSNYFITYSLKGDSLFQTWNPINHLRWEFEKSDLDTLNTILVKFKLDGAGKIVNKLDTYADTMTKYFYSDKQNLVCKEMYAIESRDLLGKWIYEYNSNGNLTKIQAYSEDQLVLTHFYSEAGLLDSTDQRGSIKKYKYIYNN